MSISAIEKIRRPDGKVVGFRDETGKLREIYNGGATRARRLQILSRKLVLFVVGEFGDCPTEKEVDAILKLNEAVGSLDKAGEILEAHDRRRQR
ncbi:hypothetical protein V5E97_06645 [Singulisphaera sp. Ch08]|uniref:Uncharacterized protein n=1 Tax=Singulisphaera sp. Ch08 TaxID=3120278 RepID=A0AAU7CKL0_9BACT